MLTNYVWILPTLYISTLKYCVTSRIIVSADTQTHEDNKNEVGLQYIHHDS